MPRKPKSWEWFHATRFLGITVLAYGLLVDDTPERGSIILGGFALLGIEKVARTERANTEGDRITAKEGSNPRDSSTPSQ